MTTVETTGELLAVEDWRPAVLSRALRIRHLLSRPGVLAFAAYGVLAFLADYPAWPGDPSRVTTTQGGDIGQTVWFLAWTPFALLHGHNLFVTNWINYPRGVDLAQNTSMPLLGLITAPLTLAVSPIASLNLLRWLAFCLSAFSAYFVIRRFTKFAPAAFVGGLLYGFSPYMVTQGEVHLNLMFEPLPPLIFWCLYEVLVRQKGSAIRWGLATGLLCAAQFYISAEVLVTTAIVAAIAVVVLFLTCIRAVPSKASFAAIALGVAGVSVVALAGYPVWLMFHSPQHYTGPAQGYDSVYNADLLGPFLPTTAQLVAPHRLAKIGSSLVGNNLDENGSYLGIPLVALALYFVLRYWRKLWFIVAAIMALAAFVLSLGPKLIVNGKLKFPTLNLPFHRISHLSGLDNILPVRLSLYVMLFVAAIVGFGIDATFADLKARFARRNDAATRRPQRVLHGVVARGAIGLAVGIAVLVALLPRWPYLSYPVGLNWSEQPAGLAIVPTGSVTLTYPYATSFADDAMLWQALAGMRFKIFGSYALVRSAKGTASLFPAVLQPKAVEAMLVNSFASVPDPDLPDLVATPTSVNAAMVARLRTFLADNHVQSIVIEMGRRHSASIAVWMREALGTPTRGGAGGEIWIHVQSRLRERAGELRPAGRPA